MPKFQLLPEALGLDLPDGRSLQRNRQGVVEVDDATAATIRGSSAYRRYNALFEVAPGRFFPGPDSFSCACGFTPWPWQKDCPRCGQELERP